MARKRLGEMLLEAGVIDEHKLQSALGHQRKWGGRLGQALVDLKLATEAQIVQALSQKFGYEVVKPGALEANPHLESALKLLPREFAQKANLVPFQADSSTISVAMSDPANIAVVDEIRFRTGRRVKIALGGDREVAEAVKRLYFAGEEQEAIPFDFEEGDATVEPIVEQFVGGSAEAYDSFYAAPAPAAPPSAAAAAVPQPARSARPPAAAPVTRPAAPVPAKPARGPAPHPAAPATGPTAARPAPLSAAPPGTAALELEELTPGRGGPHLAAAIARASAAEAAQAAPQPSSQTAGEPEEPTQTLELPIEEGAVEGGETPADMWAAGPLKGPPEEAAPPAAGSETDLRFLEVIDRLADGEQVPPEIVKPTQMAAALIRLLIRKGVVTETEFLEEFRKK